VQRISFDRFKMRGYDEFDVASLVTHRGRTTVGTTVRANPAPDDITSRGSPLVERASRDRGDWI
jgi:hypothetical protein